MPKVLEPLLDSVNAGLHSTLDASDHAARIEAKMSELRYPNETREYRDARDALLKDEQELVDKVKAVAAKRRLLPPAMCRSLMPQR